MAQPASNPPRAPALPPAIGRFRPQRVLGRGGQGVVYLAHAPDLGRPVAIKTLTRQAHDADKLLNEARHVARLEHPNIVALFEIALDQTTPHLVYQFAHGRPLRLLIDGVERIGVKRALVLGLVIFEHLRNGEQAEALKEAACSSFLSGMLAKEVCLAQQRPLLFPMRDPQRRAYVTRFGFGDDVEALKARFTYQQDAGDDIFSLAVNKGRNAVIVEAADARHAASVLAWCRELTAPLSILVFAVVVNKVCIGLIYANSCREPLRMNATELKLLNTLVRQLALGVVQR